MKHSEIKFDRLVSLARVPVAIFAVTYVVCMLAAPWTMGDWSYVQRVWDRWQGVNVGILAFAASFIAFEITRYKEDRQNEREFLAARAFLPATLSELTGYLNASAGVHMNGWNNLPQSALPNAPAEYREVFANCIRHSDAKTGKQLSEMLMWLQIHAARLERFFVNPARTVELKQLEALSGLRLDGELMARVSKLFDFARGIGDLDSRPLQWEDYRIAYLNLGLQIDDLVVGKLSLQSKTMAHLSELSDSGPA